MARKSKAQERRERFESELAYLHTRAQAGAAEAAAAMSKATKTLAGLLRPGGRWGMGGRHEHAEPYASEGCGWCGNIRHARYALAAAQVVLPLARELEREASALARTMTNAQHEAECRRRWPYMKRELQRALYRRNPMAGRFREYRGWLIRKDSPTTWVLIGAPCMPVHCRSLADAKRAIDRHVSLGSAPRGERANTAERASC